MYDAIVVGAGFAGLRAASDLAGAGASVVLLEARDRVGGRTWTRPFAGDGPAVEMGGSWFTAEHELVPGELRRHGLTVRTYGAPSAVRWRTGGVLRDGLPVPFDQLGELDRALTALARDAETPGARTDSRSFAGYLESLKVPEEVGDFLTGWWTMITGTDPAVGAVADPLTVVTSHGGVSGLLTALRYAPVEGWSTLSAAMAAVDGVELRSGAAVELLAEGDAGVRARLADGGEVEGRVAIVALPVNVLPHVGFEPPLPPSTAAATGSNAGRAIKLWVRARGVEPGVLAAGVGDGINWFYGDRDLDGDSLMLGFGFARPDFDPSARADAERAVRAFFPGAEVLAWDWHDWNADPWSRGTWATATVGDAELLTHARFPPHGRLAFATSDIAPREAGWIEGAMVSGAEAASWALELLGRG